MGSLWRSEKMSLVQLFVQADAAHDTIEELGNVDIVSFIDLNASVSSFQRNFVEELRRMDELQRKFRFFEEQIRADADANADLYFEADTKNLSLGSDLELGELEHSCVTLEAELQDSSTRLQGLIRDEASCVEARLVLDIAGRIMGSSGAPMSSGSLAAIGAAGAADLDAAYPMTQTKSTVDGVTLFSVAGTLHNDRVSTFELLLWRATRGNVFLRTVPLERTVVDPASGKEVFKSIFVVFGQGDRSRLKIRRLCESFGANVYPCPEEAPERAQLANRANERQLQLEGVISQSKLHRAQMLSNVAANLVAWRSRVCREAAIYHELNKFDYDPARKCLVGQCWTPTSRIDEVQGALRRGTERSRCMAPSILSVLDKNDAGSKPPTHFETNKVTSTFQGIIESYGVARYGEVNPTTFSVVTFPFLFGVMFGDFGHGIMLTLFALLMISMEKKVEARRRPLDEMAGMIFGGRYLLLFMGMFATYSGLLYNDCFSIGMDLFGSSWSEHYNATGSLEPTLIMNGTQVYPFGLDPAWKGVPNELLFVNPLKMKLSIIFGVVQMSLGIFLSAFNARYFKKPYDFWYVFVPQLVFFWGVFGYMTAAIFIKWATITVDVAVAPKVITIIINMFLFPGRCCTAEGMDLLFPGQAMVQWALFVSALLAVPVMLLAKPCLMKRDHKRALARRVVSHMHDDADSEPEEPFDFGDIMIHQMIHTIEFVLGAISNTASYLRLWALSLAHAELSLVFWDRVLVPQFKGGSVLGMFIGISGWLAATVAVLLVMEALSAFLHALRLHWVELMNKHYAGDGVKFMPFSFKTALKPVL